MCATREERPEKPSETLVTAALSASNTLTISPSMSAANPLQQYCLKWNNHQANLLRVFDRLLGSEQFCDVLVAAEGQTLRAHKVVLSACSSYFETIFNEFSEKNQVIILKDTKFTDVQALVQFMYKGEINVPQHQLGSLLKTAENLQVKGLADVTSSQEEDQRAPSPIAEPLPPKPKLIKMEMKPIVMNGSPTPSLKYRLPASGSGEVKRKRGRPRTLDAPGEQPDPCFAHVKITSATSLPPHSTFIPSRTSPVPPRTPHDLSGVNEGASTSGSGGREPSPPTPTPGGPLTPERIAELSIIKMPDYLLSGSRQQFWDEYYVKVIMQAVRNKEIDMKGAAELLGVSYGTLYGRYRETFGYLKHAWNKPNKSHNAHNPTPVSAAHSPFESTDQDNVLELFRTGRISIKQAATLLGMDPSLLAYQFTAKMGELQCYNDMKYQGHMNDLDEEEEELDEEPNFDEESYRHELQMQEEDEEEETLEVQPDIVMQSHCLKTEDDHIPEQSAPLSLKINVSQGKDEVKTSS